MLESFTWGEDSESNVACTIVNRDKKALKRYEEVLGAKYLKKASPSRYNLESGFWGDNSIAKLAEYLEKNLFQGFSPGIGQSEGAAGAEKWFAENKERIDEIFSPDLETNVSESKARKLRK